MRCSGCGTNLPRAARFCGGCGRPLAASEAEPPSAEPSLASWATPAERTRFERPSPRSAPTSPSWFELPVDRGARAARLAVVLSLDLVLAGAGAAMIYSWWTGRRAAVVDAAPSPDGGFGNGIEAGVPRDAGRRTHEATPGRAIPPPTSAPSDLPPRTTAAPPRPEPTLPPTLPPGSPAMPNPTTSPPPTSSAPSPTLPTPPTPALPLPLPLPPDAPSAGSSATLPVDASTAAPPSPLAPDAAPAPPADAAFPPPPPEDVELTAEAVRVVVERNMGHVQRCYERAAKVATRREPLEGKVEIQFAVLPSGDPEGVRVVENTTGSDDLASCLAALLASWKFPSPGKERVEFLWPFVFHAPR